MAFDQVSKSVAITWFTKGVYGYQPITIDEYDTDSEPELQAGFVEVGGEIYENTAALSITGWSGIANSTQTYIYIVPGGSTATAIFSSTAPTWSHAKQGWYNSNDRALWAVYKDSAGTGYTNKCELSKRDLTRLQRIDYVETIGQVEEIETLGQITGRAADSYMAVTSNNEYFATSETEDDVFTKFSAILDAGEKMHVSGGYHDGANLWVVITVQRNAAPSSNIVTFQSIRDDGTLQVKGMTSGDATAVGNIALSW